MLSLFLLFFRAPKLGKYQGVQLGQSDGSESNHGFSSSDQKGLLDEGA